MRNLTSLDFQHEFVDSLPGDVSLTPGSRQVPRAAYALVEPTKVLSPRLIAWSEHLAAQFDLKRPTEQGLETDLLAGNFVRPDMKPYASCYGGHQFGHWAGQLGDGRAITLFEAKDRHGIPHEFQLKGAGPTPFSRRADGRAVLRSSIREFIASEAMFHLGVPTTRALSLVETGDGVERDMFYDGRPRLEKGAIVGRVAPSFVRFGHFEIFASRGDADTLKQLADYVLKKYFPDLGAPSPDAYIEFFRAVARSTARLMVEWMRVGFVHGVMNTDNLSILGLTIDYGPYGWIDNYDPTWTPNTTDLPGRRYCFGRQPAIALWNLARLAEALLILAPDQSSRFEEVLTDYESSYREMFLDMMSRKLGVSKLETDEDIELIVELNELLQTTDVDMTLFFRGLATWPLEASNETPDFLRRARYETAMSEGQTSRWLTWLKAYSRRALPDRAGPMNAVNPLYVPRNYLLQQVIERTERGEPQAIEELLAVLSRPYEEQPHREAFSEKRPDWARNKPGCSTLSCSS